MASARQVSLRSLLVVFLIIPSMAAARPAFAINDGASLTGTVVDPDGRPVPNAEVLLSQAATIVARVRTDATGRFRADQLLVGQYDVHVVLEGFRSEPLTIRLAAGETRDLTVPLRLSALSESVVVSASQVDAPLSRVGESTSVITRRDIEWRQLEDAGETLRLVPGVDVAQNGGRGSVTSLFARGGESDYALVMVNGVRANAFGGGFDFSQLPLANVERVEVVRGAGSAVFGSDAIGGVVQIVTRQGGGTRVDGSLEGGSFGTMRLTASGAGSRGAWTWGGGAQRITSDGFTGIAPATGERVSNDDYRATQVTGTATWRPSGGAELALNAAWMKSDRGNPGPFGSNPIGAYTAVDRISRGRVDTRLAGASLVVPLAGGRVRQHVQASWFDLSDDFTSLYGLSASGTRRAAARSQTDISIGETTSVSAGVDLQHEQANSTFITGAAFTPVPIVRMLVGVFAEARHQQGSRLTLVGGARMENVTRSALDGSLDPFSPRPTFPADTARAFNPKGTVVYVVYPGPGGKAGQGQDPELKFGAHRFEAYRPAWMRLRASAGTGMRAPDGFEIAFTDNPHLRPERSRSAEAGIESAFASGQAIIEATYFANRYEDLIVAVGPAFGDLSRYRTDNIANARSRGLELSGRWLTRWGLQAQLAYTWLDTAVLAVDGTAEAPAPFHVGDALLRRPRHRASIDLVFARGRLAAFSEIGARGRVLDVEPTYGASGGLFWNPGYTTVRCGGSWRLLPVLDLFARVDNLFNRSYEESFGFPALGRSLMAGVRVATSR